jgi:prefoldin subunit 5
VDSELQALEQQIKQLQESVERLRQQSRLVNGGA